MLRKAFSMLELIFVIVIMGIIGVIGSEIFRTTYDSYMSSSINNKLQVETELALKQIANRLQYRFKDSVIARQAGGNFVGLSSTTVNQNYTSIEWIGYDIDGWQGIWNGTFNTPTWSGFIDVDAGDPDGDGTINNTMQLFSPNTNTNNVNTIISNVRANGSDTAMQNTAIFFTGANTDIQTGYGWNGTAIADQNGSAAHPINSILTDNEIFTSSTGDDFSNVDIYEQYKLAWTAYALSLEDNDTDGRNDELFLYHDFQPWEGEEFDDAAINNTAIDDRKHLLLDNVQTFQVQAVGDVIKVQICVDNNDTGNIPANQIYSLCKEKVIF